MIQYTLKCTDGHRFDSWFQSAVAYDKLAGAGMVSCAICGSSKVEKAIMTPRVRPARATSASETPPKGTLSEPASVAEQAMADLKRKIEESSDYVGKDFVREARAMHDGTAPERSIYGEAKPEDARALIEDGVPVTPLPFLPNRKTN